MRGVGVACKPMFLMPFLTTPVRARRFASLVVTLQGYKAGNCLCVNLHPLARSPITSSPPSLQLKRKREIDLETGESVC
jgi:hypothetical protein